MFGVINSYLGVENAPTNKELELRIRITDAQLYKTIYERFTEAAESESIEKSILTIINQDRNTRRRRETYFNPDGSKTETYIEKTSGKYWLSKSGMYKLSEATELEIPIFKVDAADIIRFRVRKSITLSNFPDWRFDFTTIKELNRNEINQIPRIKKQMFEGTTQDQIPGVKNEFEVEFIPHEKTKLSTEVIEKTVNDIMKYIDKILNIDLEEDSDVQQIVFKVADLLLTKYAEKYQLSQFRQHYGLKELSNNPITLSRSTFQEIHQQHSSEKNVNWFVTEKTDGLRCFLILGLDGENKVLSNGMVEDLAIHVPSQTTILDAEKVSDKEYRIFDILMLNNKEVANQPFEERYELILQVTEQPTTKKEKIKIMRKDMTLITAENYTKTIKKYSQIKGTDGLIFTPANAQTQKDTKQRFKTRCDYFDMKVYKFKPPKDLTTDFLIMEVPQSLMGKKPFIIQPPSPQKIKEAKEKKKTEKTEKKEKTTKNQKTQKMYVLFCGITWSDKKTLNIDLIPGYDKILDQINYTDKYFPIQFSPSVQPDAFIFTTSETEQDFNGKIGEFKYEGKPPTGEWKLLRLREDKQASLIKGVGFGNNFRVAESTLIQFFNPLEIDELIDPVKTTSEYFVKDATKEYKPLTKVNNFVTSQMIRQLEKSNFVIDLAAGKGQNLFTWNCFGIKNIICQDIDAAALEELNRRRYIMDTEKTCIYNTAGSLNKTNNMHTWICQSDLNDPAQKNIDLIRSFTPDQTTEVDGILINLALHYIISDKSSLRNFITLISNLLKKNGLFIFTAFDGDRIQTLLKHIKKGQTWEAGKLESGETKYAIRKDYDDKTSKSAKKIAVRHHFAGGKFYEENLLDIQEVINTFQNSGFSLIRQGSFADMHPEYKQFNRTFAEKLTKEDLLYSSLYSYVTLIKK